MILCGDGHYATKCYYRVFSTEPEIFLQGLRPKNCSSQWTFMNGYSMDRFYNISSTTSQTRVKQHGSVHGYRHEMIQFRVLRSAR